MTVSTAYAPLTYSGNSSATAFSVTWPFFSGSLIVTAIDASGVETVKTLTTHYTVAGGTDADGLPATGTVTMLTAPATGTQIRIARATPLIQATTWDDGDAFPAATVEAALDRGMLIAQENAGGGAAYDGITGDVMTLDSSGASDVWDGESHILANLADAVSDTDAMTLGQGNQILTGAISVATNGVLTVVQTLTALAAADISVVVTSILALGRAAGGDCGEPIVLQRIATPSPVQIWHATSGDGAYWEIQPGANGLNVLACGVTGDGVTDDWAALDVLANDWTAAYAAANGSVPGLWLPARLYHLSQVLEFAVPVTVNAYGAIVDHGVWWGVQESGRLLGLTIDGAPGNGLTLFRMQDDALRDIHIANCGGFGVCVGGYYRSQVTRGVLDQIDVKGCVGGVAISVSDYGLSTLTLTRLTKNDIGSITAAGSGYTNGTHIVTVTALTGTGVEAVAKVTVAGGAVTAFAALMGGSGYAAGDTLSIAGATIGAGAGFVYTVGAEINDDRSWLNATQWHGLRVRDCTHYGILGPTDSNSSYNSAYGWQFEGNVTGSVDLIRAYFAQWTFTDCHIAIVNTDTDASAKLFNALGLSQRNTIIGGRWSHNNNSTPSGTLLFTDLVDLGDQGTFIPGAVGNAAAVFELPILAGLVVGPDGLTISDASPMLTLKDTDTGVENVVYGNGSNGQVVVSLDDGATQSGNVIFGVYGNAQAHKFLKLTGNTANGSTLELLDDAMTARAVTFTADGALAIDGQDVARISEVSGTAVFSAATSAAVTFATAQPDTAYQVAVEAQGNYTVYITAKGTGGFTINTSSSITATLRWRVVR